MIRGALSLGLAGTDLVKEQPLVEIGRGGICAGYMTIPGQIPPLGTVRKAAVKAKWSRVRNLAIRIY